MARVLCTLPNASDEIGGIAFTKHPKGMLSEEIDEAAASRLTSIDGYTLVDNGSGADGGGKGKGKEKDGGKGGGAADSTVVPDVSQPVVNQNGAGAAVNAGVDGDRKETGSSQTPPPAGAPAAAGNKK